MARPLVDLYLYATHEVPTWAPIVDALRALQVDARFVLEPPGRNLARGSSPDASKGWLDDKRSQLRPLVDDEMHDRLLGQLAAIGEAPLDRLRPGADAAITSAGAAWLRPWSGARIRCMYGVGLVVDAWGHGAINQGFDLVLALGPFSKREISTHVTDATVADVGYPKWAAYRRGEVDRAAARRTLGAGDDAEVVLWLPTWAHHSSLDRYRDAFGDLGADRTVVVKPHNNTARFEQGRLDRAEPGAAPTSIVVTEATADLRVLAAAADVVVSDVRSGGLTEGLLADRPTVALADPASEPDRLHPLGDSVVVRCDSPQRLAAAVHEALQDRDPAARHRLVADLFGPGDGLDAERAAAAVVEAIGRVGRPAGRRAAAPLWRAAYRTARRIGR